jgi:hypothetical protein
MSNESMTASFCTWQNPRITSNPPAYVRPLAAPLVGAGGRWRVDKSVLGFYNGVNIIGDVWGKLKYRT